jgi:glycosyltransferase involved in cell wall biosynthesis
MTRSSLKHFDQIIVMSKRMKNEVLAHAAKQPLHVIPDPIDLQSFKPISRADARTALGRAGNIAPWVLFTALDQKSPIKRWGLAREAVEYAQKEIPQLELCSASQIEYQHMPLLVNACDAIICTSTHEGWPNSIKEAMAVGLPIVTTDVSDLRSLAAKSAAIFVEQADPVRLGSALISALRHGRDAQLIEEARRFSMEESAKSLMEVYKSSLAAKGAPAR